MKHFWIFGLILALILVSQSSATTYKINGKIVDQTTICRQIEQRFFKCLNEHREKLGLSTLKVMSANSDIAKLCREHAVYLSEVSPARLGHDHSMAHDNYQQRVDLCAKTISNMTKGGEIVFPRFTMDFDPKNNLLIEATADRLLEGFLSSGEHKGIIEKPYSAGSCVVAGSVLQDNKIILVVDFIGID